MIMMCRVYIIGLYLYIYIYIYIYLSWWSMTFQTSYKIRDVQTSMGLSAAGAPLRLSIQQRLQSESDQPGRSVEKLEATLRWDSSTWIRELGEQKERIVVGLKRRFSYTKSFKVREWIIVDYCYIENSPKNNINDSMTNNIYLLILTKNWRVSNLTANLNIVPRRETKATRALLNELAAARAAIYHGVKQEAPCSGTPRELQASMQSVKHLNNLMLVERCPKLRKMPFESHFGTFIPLWSSPLVL